MVAIFTSNGQGTHSSSSVWLGKRGQVGEASVGQNGEQVYVNAANGNLLIQDRDQMLLGLGGNSTIFRAYNSLNQGSGDNWRPGGARTVTQLTGTLNTAGSTITLTDWDGSSTTYAYNTSRSIYVSTATSIEFGVAPDRGAAPVSAQGRDTLSFDAKTQSWVWTSGTHDQMQRFDAAQGGRLASAYDRDGNTVTYTYDTKGRLSKVTTSGGDVTYLDYNASGQLIDLMAEYRLADGRTAEATTTRYGYDAQGRLSEVIVDLSPLDSSIADGNVFKTTYTYDGTSSRIASIAQSDGSRVAFTYALVGSDYRVATIAQAAEDGVTRVTSLSYDVGKRQTTIIDPVGFKQVMSYDSAGRVTRVTTTGAGETHNQEFNYDGNGNLYSISDDVLGNVAALGYDSAGNLVRQSGGYTDVMRTFGADNELLTDGINKYAYDSTGHLRYMISGEGRVTEYRYNSQGQRVSEIRYTGSRFEVSRLGRDTAVPLSDIDAWLSALPDRSQAERIDTVWDYRNQIASQTRYGACLGTAPATRPPAWCRPVTCMTPSAVCFSTSSARQARSRSSSSPTTGSGVY